MHFVCQGGTSVCLSLEMLHRKATLWYLARQSEQFTCAYFYTHVYTEVLVQRVLFKVKTLYLWSSEKKFCCPPPTS